MNCSRAFLVSSSYSPPHHHRPPDIRKPTCAATATTTTTSSCFNKNHFWSGEGLFLVRKRLGSRIFADVKSEPYDITASPPESIQLKDDKKNGNGDDDIEEDDVLWWEEFPKRWVIVILCFSAFLLCNMDRVSLFTLNCTRLVFVCASHLL